MKNKLLVLTFSLVISLVAGAFGSIFTQTSVSTWYINLVKPSFNPPSWVFSPVWTLLYILMGIALFLVLTSKVSTKKRTINLTVFFIQWLLNILWSFLFFFLQSPLAGFIGIILLFISILLMTACFYRTNKLAGYLLIPYILWVMFAGTLNYFIWIMN